MSSRRFSLVVFAASCLLGAGAFAQDSDTVRSRVITNQAVPAAQPEEPRRTTRDAPAPTITAGTRATAVDSVAEDLQKIVVLCATEPESEGFMAEWSAYVARHNVTEAELDALIDDVIRRAERYRAEQTSSQRTNRMLTIATTTKSRMHDTAKAMINNIR